MLPYRLSVAVLCALLLSGAVVGTTPSCGRKATARGPACCRREATCPMHQRHTSGALGFNACQGDGTDAANVVTDHRAVLTNGVSTMVVPERANAFEATVQFLPQISLVPLTPPPRLG
jgi:hypothetical protein